uniref:Uncharacterized protein n=1 Tax=Arundo donax TaxID=35708 RepID=A0A0A8ZH02_ARUDO
MDFPIEMSQFVWRVPGAQLTSMIY